MSIGRRVVLAGMLGSLPLPFASAQGAAGARTPLEGVWDYVAPRNGQTIYHGNNYVMFSTRPDSAATVNPPSEADQARLYRSLSLQSGTFSITDSVVTMFETRSKNPRQAPVAWRWSYSIKGDTMTWRVLNAQGQVTSTGIAVRAPGSR